MNFAKSDFVPGSAVSILVPLALATLSVMKSGVVNGARSGAQEVQHQIRQEAEGSMPPGAEEMTPAPSQGRSQRNTSNRCWVSAY